MLLISGIQQTDARTQIRQDLERTAEMELIIKARDVSSSLEDVKLALRNHVWEFEQFLPYEAFGEALEAAKQDPEKAKRLSSLIAYQDMAHGQRAVMIPADNQYTSQVLYRLGFRWSSTSWDYADQMLKAIAGFGYFE